MPYLTSRCSSALTLCKRKPKNTPGTIRTGWGLLRRRQLCSTPRRSVPLPVCWRSISFPCMTCALTVIRIMIAPDAVIIPLTTSEVQKHLRKVCDYLGYEGISTHSFRKWYATEIYRANGYNIALVQQLLQHSSPAVTQRYIGIQQKEVEQAIESHLCLDI